MSKIRLDNLLVEKGLAQSRERARALILSGKVLVDGLVRDKAGAQVSPHVELCLKGGDIPYVSRGGVKLQGALDHFGLDVSGLSCLDVGASTGGFTDCLLSRGAVRVCCVDVGYGQLAWSLRNDPRVSVLERTNARNLTPADIPFAPDLCVIDVSFISLRLVLPAVVPCLAQDGAVLALIKPQFEVGKGEVGKKGVVRDPALHERVCQEISACARSLGMDVAGVVPSPILGPEGNREFFLLARRV
ncbi:MAG: TlyA family RNA methyltransferase [Thermodesulfobacteriota bacterium]